MQTELAPRDTLRGFFSGHRIDVVRAIGGGRQGAIWEVRFGDRARALKWYSTDYLLRDDPGIRDRIHRLVNQGAPSPDFLWPTEVAVRADGSGFGYIMPLLERRFRKVGALLLRVVEPSYATLCVAGMRLADQFLRLHADGLCYRDISFDNLALDMNTGDVRILDNDNVDIDGSVGPMKGTPLFMAPEVVREEALPSTASDQHSLAVLLFYMFCFQHPLEGRRELQREFAGDRLYAEPLFIFDEHDQSNSPDPVVHRNAWAAWHVYPARLHALFRRAFGPGLHDPKRRVTDSEWRQEMLSLRDTIFGCPTCKAENFLDASAPSRRCWACGGTLRES